MSQDAQTIQDKGLVVIWLYNTAICMVLGNTLEFMHGSLI